MWAALADGNRQIEAIEAEAARRGVRGDRMDITGARWGLNGHGWWMPRRAMPSHVQRP
jgi:hypothetical protein